MNDINKIIDLCVAKLSEDENGKPIGLGMSVQTHCILTGLTTRELLNRMPQSYKNLFPAWCPIIVALHDIGKINPMFQEKIRRNIDSYIPNSEPLLKDADPGKEKQTGYHGGVSCLTILDESDDKPLATIAGSHHGYAPDLPDMDATDKRIGGQLWEDARKKEIEVIEEALEIHLPADSGLSDSPAKIGLLAGLTTCSDWLASSIDIKTEPKSKDDYRQFVGIIKKTLDDAGFICPLIRKGLPFEYVFNGYKANDMQASFADMVNGPGVHIAEAQMGEGKTEAALFAAYKMLESGKASGIYFALPTQLTSNKIYDRFRKFLSMILSDEDPHKPLLVHNDAWIYETELGGDGAPGFQWFDSNKRALLAPFAVGTIDQALIGSLNAKHSFVRLFGLANKVVIFDEVHTYDSYTGTILNSLIRLLSQLNCTIIILSATLSNAAKRMLLGANISSSIPNNYPQIVKASINPPAIEAKAIKSNIRKVYVHYMENEDSKAFETAKEKAANGELVLWIENTVAETQDVFKTLAAWGCQNDVEVGLLHSRFTKADRASNEEKWVYEYGAARKNTVKAGKILVGTQVLEQSLDIDADLLITRLAPSDMLFQRIGRLHRHRENDVSRPFGSRPEAIVLAPEFSSILKSTEHAFGSSGYVYAPYYLYRTAAIWKSTSELDLPSSILDIIERTYSEETQNLSEAVLASRAVCMSEREKLKRFAYQGMTAIGKQSDDKAKTRYSEDPTCPVLLLKRISSSNTGHLILNDGSEIILHEMQFDKNLKRKAAKALSVNMLDVPSRQAPPIVQSTLLKLIRRFIFFDMEADSCLRIGIVDNSGAIHSEHGFESKEYDLSYDARIGYQARKKERS